MPNPTARPVPSAPLDPTDDPPWTMDRLGGLTFAMMQAVDALTQTVEVQTKLLRKVVEAATAPGESSEFSPLNRNLSQIALLLKANGDLLTLICQQVGGSPPATP
jgi:hypothetical protein